MVDTVPHDAFCPTHSGGLVYEEDVCSVTLDSDLCQTPNRPYLMAKDSDNSRFLLTRPNCNMWGCPHCRKSNAARWAEYGASGMRSLIEHGQKFWFVTLTTHRVQQNLLKTIEIWRDAWRKLYWRLKRVLEGPLYYLMIPELSPEKMRFHAHMLINQSLGAEFKVTPKHPEGYWSSRWLKDKPAECGLGFMNDIKPVDNPSFAAWYITKYTLKSCEIESWPQNFKRVQHSQNWPKLQQKDGLALEWNVIRPDALPERIFDLWKRGFNVLDIRTGELVEASMFS